MKNRKLIKNFRNQFVNVHALTVVIVSLLELVGYFVFLSEDMVNTGFKEPYLWKCVIFPIAANATVHLVARILIFVSSISYEKKNAVIVYAALATAIIVSVCHREFAVTSCSFIFPMTLTSVFNDRKLLKQCVCITAVAYVIISVVLYIENQITVLRNLNTMILFGFVFVSYLCAKISVDFSEKSFQIITSQEFDNERLKDKTRHDSMTGLLNHKSFHLTLETAIKVNKSDNINVCLAMLDIDDFKNINDTYGHDYGDTVIKSLSEIMLKYCPDDKVCRYGGEEFAIIFLDKKKEEAKYLLKRILGDFSSMEFGFAKNKLTFSCGVEQYDGISAKNEFFSEVDRKLYDAKKSGKNQIVD